MNALRASNVIVFRPRKAAIPTHPRTAARPLLRAAWRVSAETGCLECTWTDATASEIPYSSAA